MQLDYNLLLDNVKRRHFDEAIGDHILSPSFVDETIAAPVRYVMESMREVEPGYTYKVYATTKKIEAEIANALKESGIHADVRYQGPLRTECHIGLYGEVDLLFLLDQKASSKDVFTLGQKIRELVASQNHQSIDYSSGLKIQLVSQKPACKINIIPGRWINNARYVDKKNEIYRGVAVFNFKAKTKMKNLPFLNMSRINVKDQTTNGGFKKIIRLFKAHCTDDSIDLTTNELAGLMYGIDNSQITCNDGHELSILSTVNTYIENLITQKEKFETLLSPSEKELVFGNRKEKHDAVSGLQKELGNLIADLKESLDGGLDSKVDYVFEPPNHSDSE